MKVYLGGKQEAYAAFWAIVYIFLPPLFGLFALLGDKGFFGFLVLLIGILNSVVTLLYLKRYGKKVFAWGFFDEGKILVKGFGFRSYSVQYDKIASIESASYVHGIFNSKIGTTHHYICFSYDYFDEKYRNQINLWEISPRRVKVKYSPELCRFLLQVMQPKQTKMLLKCLEKQGLELS